MFLDPGEEIGVVVADGSIDLDVGCARLGVQPSPVKPTPIPDPPWSEMDDLSTSLREAHPEAPVLIPLLTGS